MREVIMAPLILLLMLPGVSAAQPGNGPDRRPIGEIEFFGYKGLDVDRVRAALPIHEGDLFPPSAADGDPAARIKQSVRQTLGGDATDVQFTCCDDRQLWIVYIGLPGESSRVVSFSPPPTGQARLPSGVMELHEEYLDAWGKAVLQGNGVEDDSQGFALSADSALRAIEMKLRQYALKHEREVIHVLETSTDVGHRAAAATTLGYARASLRQVNALIDASFDVDGTVRNNAIRALDVLFGARSDLAKRVPIDRFLPLLSSGQWTDLNKGVMLFDVLTRGRDQALLARLRAAAFDNLVEMARWDIGHAGGALLLLGRIAGMEEGRLQELVQHQRRVDEIISAASAH
jgi:hypothetical protein